MKPVLVIVTGERAGERHDLQPSQAFIFGRDNNCDFPLLEKKVSRKHATLIWDELNDKVFIEDLKSLNGTYVNGTLISEPTELKDHDRFQIGSFTFELQFDTQIKIEHTGLTDIPSLPSGSILRRTDPSIAPSSDELFDANPSTDGSSISGKLSEVSLADLLQMFAATKKSGRLVIAHKKKDVKPDPAPGTPSIYLENGEVMSAELRDMRNEEAFYEIVRWSNGYFSLYPHLQSPSESRMRLPLEALLLEGFRRLDEEKTATVQFNPDAEFDVKLDEPLSSLEPDELRIFQIVWKKKKMGNIWAQSHLDPKSTDAIIRKLIRSGYIKKIN